MIIIALILFFITFYLVNRKKECALASSNGGGFAGRDYTNAAFMNSAARSVLPTYGRLTSVFKHMSPEDWPFNSPNKAAMLTVAGRGPIVGIPTAPGETPYFGIDPVQVNLHA